MRWQSRAFDVFHCFGTPATACLRCGLFSWSGAGCSSLAFALWLMKSQMTENRQLGRLAG